MVSLASRILFILNWSLYPILHSLGLLGYGEAHHRDWASKCYLTESRSLPAKRLPTTRPRRLTLPLPPQSPSALVTVQKTKSQAQSTFFTKLPAEIRVVIYEMALSGSGGVLHIVRPAPHCLGHVRCTKIHGRCENYGCFTYCTPDEENPKKQGTFHKTSGNLLPLLLTCREIYTEAISTLYSQNIFEFRDVLTFLCFLTTILSSRTDTIRNIKLDNKITNDSSYLHREDVKLSPYDDTAWKCVCDMLKKMSGLQDLQIELRMGDPADFRMGRQAVALTAEQEFQLLSPLMEIRHAKKFLVSLGWPMQWIPYEDRGWWDKPFEIIDTSLENHRTT